MTLIREVVTQPWGVDCIDTNGFHWEFENPAIERIGYPKVGDAIFELEMVGIRQMRVAFNGQDLIYRFGIDTAFIPVPEELE